MKAKLWIPFAAIAFALAGCAAGEDVLATSGAGYLEDPAAVVAGADWSRAERIDVGLSEFEFAPSDLRLQHGKPYRLHLENDGNVTHYFVSAEFFKAIAVARLETPAGTLEAPRLQSIAVPPGAAKELYFVPVARGAYDLECTAPLHALFGMVGRISIE